MNRLTSISGTKSGVPYAETFEYDGGVPTVGLMTQRSRRVFDDDGDPTGAYETMSSGYDRMNRLTNVMTSDGTANVYTYAGPSWMRTSATVMPGAGAPVTTNYTYDGFACLRQITGGAALFSLLCSYSDLVRMGRGMRMGRIAPWTGGGVGELGHYDRVVGIRM